MCLPVAATYTCSRKHTQVWRLTQEYPNVTSAAEDNVKGITGADPQTFRAAKFRTNN